MHVLRLCMHPLMSVEIAQVPNPIEYGAMSPSKADPSLAYCFGYENKTPTSSVGQR